MSVDTSLGGLLLAGLRTGWAAFLRHAGTFHGPSANLTCWYCADPALSYHYLPSRVAYAEGEDIWFRYASQQNVDRWAKYLIEKLSNCLRQVATWDERTLLY